MTHYQTSWSYQYLRRLYFCRLASHLTIGGLLGEKDNHIMTCTFAKDVELFARCVSIRTGKVGGRDYLSFDVWESEWVCVHNENVLIIRMVMLIGGICRRRLDKRKWVLKVDHVFQYLKKFWRRGEQELKITHRNFLWRKKLGLEMRNFPVFSMKS